LNLKEELYPMASPTAARETTIERSNTTQDVRESSLEAEAESVGRYHREGNDGAERGDVWKDNKEKHSSENDENRARLSMSSNIENLRQALESLPVDESQACIIKRLRASFCLPCRVGKARCDRKVPSCRYTFKCISGLLLTVAF
jgi:hypothetical protein